MAEAPRGWNVIFKANYKQATSAQVAPNASENISVDITAPSNVKAGTYKYLSSLLPAPLLPNSSLKWLSPDRTVLN